MVVISDTSVISNLLIVGKLSLLQRLFGEVFIPLAVQQELVRMPDSAFFSLHQWPWIKVVPVKNEALVRELTLLLDPGEAEAIALAEELQADVLLIDEAKGRRIARARNIDITGLLGVLLAAKKQGYIDSVCPIMDQLIAQASFRISKTLYQLIQKEAEED